MIVIWIIAIVAGIYILFACYLFIFQSNYVYYPNLVLTIPTEDPNRIELPFENISFKTSDGLKLSGWFIPKENARGVLVFCHGNAGNIRHRLESIKLFNRLGLEVFIFDYRGYGESEGKPTEKGTYQDAEAAWYYLVEDRHVDPAKIIVFGRSLGGGIASWLGAKYTPGALILESTFTSLPDIAATRYWFMPIRLLIRIKYNTAERLSNINCPILVVHSHDDEDIPFNHGQRLYQIASEPKEFLEIAGTHNEGFITSGALYEDGLNNFILQHMDSL